MREFNTKGSEVKQVKINGTVYNLSAPTLAVIKAINDFMGHAEAKDELGTVVAEAKAVSAMVPQLDMSNFSVMDISDLFSFLIAEYKNEFAD